MASHKAAQASPAAWLLLALLAAAAAAAQPLPEQTLEEAESAEAVPVPLQYLLVQRLLDARLAAEQGRPLRKRTCLINAGLSHGCDYKDLVGAMEESNYWNSALSPGRRRRSLFSEGQTQPGRSQEVEYPVVNSHGAEMPTERRGVIKVKKNELHNTLNRMPSRLNAFPEAELARHLALLARASAGGQAFHQLDVPHSAIKTYCHLDNNRQCREACFYLGDSACVDGNMAHNGNDNAFLYGGFHPGK